MLKSALKSTLLLAFIVSLGYAQAPTPTQQDQEKSERSDASLDNHRPLIQKKEKAPTSRTVTGIVTDDSGQPLNGALVTMTNLDTKEKRSFFTKKDGRYTFDDIAFTQDYQVQAKWKALVSVARNISQYDHTAKVVRLLQVQTPEGYAGQATAAAEVKK